MFYRAGCPQYQISSPLLLSSELLHDVTADAARESRDGICCLRKEIDASKQ